MNEEFDKFMKTTFEPEHQFSECDLNIAYLAGAAAMREKDEKALCANCKAEGLNVRCDLCTDIAAIRKVEVE